MRTPDLGLVQPVRHGRPHDPDPAPDEGAVALRLLADHQRRGAADRGDDRAVHHQLRDADRDGDGAGAAEGAEQQQRAPGRRRMGGGRVEGEGVVALAVAARAEEQRVDRIGHDRGKGAADAAAGRRHRVGALVELREGDRVPCLIEAEHLARPVGGERQRLGRRIPVRQAERLIEPPHMVLQRQPEAADLPVQGPHGEGARGREEHVLLEHGVALDRHQRVRHRLEQLHRGPLVEAVGLGPAGRGELHRLPVHEHPQVGGVVEGERHREVGPRLGADRILDDARGRGDAEGAHRRPPMKPGRAGAG